MKQTITYKTVIVIFLVFLITVSLAACLGGNKDDTEGVESTTTPGTTTSTTEQQPTPTPAPTPTPNGSVDSKLVGKWATAQSGNSLYYEFRADGTYSYHVISPIPPSSDGKHTLCQGRWSVSNGTVYLLQVKMTEWNYDDGPTNWKDVADSSMRIIFEEEHDEWGDRFYFCDIDRGDDFPRFLKEDNFPSWLIM